MKGKGTVTYIDPKTVSFSEGGSNYRKVSIVDDEGFSGSIYVPANVVLKFGDKVDISACPNSKGFLHLKYLKEE